MSATRAAIALGSNLNNTQAQVEAAFVELGALPSTELLERSALYRTAPVGYLDQPWFVNACALVETTLTPRELLEALLAIERSHGRVRDIPNGPRTLDLDIVTYGEQAIAEPGLTIPHPRAHERAFVLAPLLQVWPDATLAAKGRADECLARMGSEGVERIVDSEAPRAQSSDRRPRGNRRA